MVFVKPRMRSLALVAVVPLGRFITFDRATGRLHSHRQARQFQATSLSVRYLQPHHVKSELIRFGHDFNDDIVIKTGPKLRADNYTASRESKYVRRVFKSGALEVGVLE